MNAPEILALITKWMASPTGIATLALLGSWFAGKGINLLMQSPTARKVLAYGLKTAGAPAVVVGKWLQVGPLTILSGPIVCLLIFVGFWFFTFMDRLLTYLKPDTRALAEALEKMLGEVGSTDRKLYIMAKGMTQDQVAVVASMAEAVKAGPDSLTDEQQGVLLQAQAVGRQLQAERLSP
jgi:hypothetical protein